MPNKKYKISVELPGENCLKAAGFANLIKQLSELLGLNAQVKVRREINLPPCPKVEISGLDFEGEDWHHL